MRWLAKVALPAVPAPVSPVAPTQAPAGSGPGPALPWLWLALGIAAVVVVAMLMTRRSRRRSARSASWHRRLVDASAKGSALHDIMATAESPDVWAADDAGLRWAEIQRRTDGLTQDLDELHDIAPGEIERARVTEVLACLRAVRSAMSAEHTPGAVRSAGGARVQFLLGSFEQALRQLRSPAGNT